ncbi:unnamed protein product [Ciceribacter sp. T2.26MG-112.2]|nr:unnamed protein product [Ciceribacter naphthalenivorans]
MAGCDEWRGARHSARLPLQGQNPPRGPIVPRQTFCRLAAIETCYIAQLDRDIERGRTNNGMR